MSKHQRVHRTAALISTFSLVVLAAGCVPADAANESAGDATAGIDAKAMLADLEDKVETARDKFISLAEAVPEDRWDWRPMEGVRSFREVFIHIAADNWWPTHEHLGQVVAYARMNEIVPPWSR